MKDRILPLALVSCAAPTPPPTSSYLETDTFSLTVPAGYTTVPNDDMTEVQLLKGGVPACVVTQYQRVDDDRLIDILRGDFTKLEVSSAMTDLFALIRFPYAPVLDAAYGGYMASGDGYGDFEISFALPVFAGDTAGVICVFYFTSDNAVLCVRVNLDVINGAEIESLLSDFATK